jgi:O-antigen ligase
VTAVAAPPEAGAPAPDAGSVPPSGPARAAAVLGALLAAAVPAALAVYLSLRSGGYPPGLPAIGATLMGVAFAVRVLIFPGSLCRPPLPAAIAIVALAAFAGWELLSGGWSHAPIRAIADADRTILYVLVVGFAATLPARAAAYVPRLAFLALVGVSVVGLVAWVRPDLITVSQLVDRTRLSYPISYWNAFALLAAVGAVLGLHLTSDRRQPAALRVLAAAAIPMFACVAYFTQSRGGLAIGAAGVVALVVLGFSRSLLVALVAVVPTTAIAFKSAYDAVAFVTASASDAERLAQGRGVASTVLACAVAAGVVRALLLAVEPAVHRHALRSPSPRARGVALGVVAALAVVLALALGAPGAVHRQFDNFLSDAPTTPLSDPRARLTQVYNDGRLTHWRVALEASRGERLHGIGAGTFGAVWERLRPDTGLVTDAHSLYVETLAELGIVGLVALVVALAALLAGVLTGLRRRARIPAVGAAVVLGMWLLDASIEWIWEMPAITVPVLAIAAAAGAAVRRALARPRAVGLLASLAVSAVVLGIAVLPALAALGQTSANHAIRAYDAADCTRAQADAQTGISRFGALPNLYAVQALCLARTGAPGPALRAIDQAIERDPLDWQLRYDKALIAAATGRNPRPALAAALARNPRGLEIATLRQALRGKRGAERRSAARRQPPYLDGRPRATLLQLD